MKKKFIILGSIAAVLIVAGIILTVVLLKPKDTPPVEDPVEPTVQLEVPRGITLNGSVLSWDSVENATEYVVYVNDKEYTTTECSIDLNGKANERDILKVVARGKAYIDSKSSIEKVYITVVDKVEVTSMATNLSNYISNIGYDDTTLEQIAPAIENVCVALYKEGLVASDVENIVTTLDSVVDGLGNIDAENPSELVEKVAAEVAKLESLNISSYALTVALKEVANFAVDVALEDMGVSKQNVCLVVKYPVQGMTEEDVKELLVNLNDYLDNIKNRDLEKVAIVIDTIKNVYKALNEEIPSIVLQLENIETTVKGEVSYEAIYSVLENIVKMKDSVISSVLKGMPSMEEFTEVVSLLESVYANMAPDYIVENNPYDLIILEAQKMYAGAHKLLSFIGEMDAELLLKIKPHLTNIYNVLEEDYNDFWDYMMKPSFDGVMMDGSIAIIFYALEKTGLSEEEIEELLFGVMTLVEDITETPEELLTKVSNAFSKEAAEAFKGIDFSILTKDPLVSAIMTIVTSEDPKLALNNFLKDDLKVEQYISYKEGKTFEDLVNTLLFVSIEDIVTFFSSQQDGVTVDELLSAFGLDEVINSNVEGLMMAIVKMVNVETMNLLTDLMKVENIEDVEQILAKYFKVEVNFGELFNNVLNNILAEYNLDLEYKTMLDNVIKAFGLDKIFEELKSIYSILETSVNEFNANYVPLLPTENEITKEALEEYLVKNVTYMIFGDNSEAAVKDLDKIFELIVGLKDENEIVNIFNKVVELVTNYDYSFDFDAYINNPEYKEAFNKKLIGLLNGLFDEADNAINWVLGFEDDLEEIAKLIDEFTTKYFGGSFELNYYVNYVFEMLYMYKITDTAEKIGKDTIKDIVENVLSTVLNDVNDFIAKLEELYGEVYNVIGDNIEEMISYIAKFEEVFDYEQYATNEEYRTNFNQKVINLFNDLVDKFVLLYDEALTTEENVASLLAYVDEITVKYFNESLYLEDLVREFYVELANVQPTESDASDLKGLFEYALNNIYTPMLVEMYNVSDEAVALITEAINDIYNYASKLVELEMYLHDKYIEYYQYYVDMLMTNEVDFRILAIKKLYNEESESIAEVCNILTEIITPEDMSLLTYIDERMEYVANKADFDLEMNATDMYKELVMIIEIIESLDEMIVTDPEILDKINKPVLDNKDLEDIIIPN